MFCHPMVDVLCFTVHFCVVFSVSIYSKLSHDLKKGQKVEIIHDP